MVELIGELCIPSDLIVPTHPGSYAGKAGCLFISSGKLYFNPTDGGAAELITSA